MAVMFGYKSALALGADYLGRRGVLSCAQHLLHSLGLSVRAAYPTGGK
jgi:hypothetical protein